MTGAFIRRGHRDTGRRQRQGTGVWQPQAKECQGVPAASRSQERGLDSFSLRASRRNQSWQHPDPELLAAWTLSTRFCRFNLCRGWFPDAARGNQDAASPAGHGRSLPFLPSWDSLWSLHHCPLDPGLPAPPLRCMPPKQSLFQEHPSPPPGPQPLVQPSAGRGHRGPFSVKATLMADPPLPPSPLGPGCSPLEPGSCGS